MHQGVGKPGRAGRESARVKQSRGPRGSSACQDTARDKGVLQWPDPNWGFDSLSSTRRVELEISLGICCNEFSCSS